VGGLKRLGDFFFASHQSQRGAVTWPPILMHWPWSSFCFTPIMACLTPTLWVGHSLFYYRLSRCDISHSFVVGNLNTQMKCVLPNADFHVWLARTQSSGQNGWTFLFISLSVTIMNIAHGEATVIMEWSRFLSKWSYIKRSTHFPFEIGIFDIALT